MTIASEITRLQTDKEAMRQAIIGKGVDVASSVSFDDYAYCIDAIPSGPQPSCVDFMLVGGGGGGGTNFCAGTGGYPGGGGGGGGVIQCCLYEVGIMGTISENNICVIVGIGGDGGNVGTHTHGCNGGDTCICGVVAYGGGGGGGGDQNGCDGASGGGAGGTIGRGGKVGGNPIIGQGFKGGDDIATSNNKYHFGGGGGGLATAGCNSGACINANGGNGCCINFDGEYRWYSGGGGGGGSGRGGCGGCGGANGCCGRGCNACCYGGGGGGGGYNRGNCSCGGSGGGGVAIIRYPTDGSYGINCATGGTETTATIDGIEYKIHTFTSNGTFSVVS